MTLKTNTLRDAITFALAAGTTALVGTGAAFAQDSGSEGQELDRVTVIGSRIPRAAETEGTAPVLTLDRAAIEQTGLTSVGDVLFNITASDGGALRNITTSTNGSDGTQNVSLRGLGSSRTLILVNGRRWVAQGGGVVDLNTIPISVVERIEVLKDGASAIYGSDAIAGVINIITRTNFDGAEASAYFGGYTKGDGFQQAFDFTIGADSDRWNAVLGLSYTDNEPVYAGDREIAEVPVFGGGDVASGGLYGSGSNAYGNLVRCALGFVTTSQGFRECADGPDANTNPDTITRTLTAGLSGRTATDFRPFRSLTTDNSGNTDRYNFAPINYIVQPIERFSLYTQGSLRLTDRINANVQGVYIKRDSNQQLAEVPLTMNLNGSNGPQWAFAPTAGNVFNPFGQDLRSANFRMIAAGPRKPYYDNDNTAVTGWLDGSFEVAGRAMYWDAGYSFLNSRISARNENYVNLFNLRRAVGNSRRNPTTNALECLDATGAVIAGCVPFNLFGGPDLGLAAGVISRAEYDAMLSYVTYTQNNFQENTTKDYFANLSGEIIELPAGPLGFAVGLEHRRDEFLAQPDALVAGGGSSDNFTLPTSGQVQVDEYYAELNVPILADIPGFKLLELNVATRGSDYSTRGIEARVNQFTGAQIIRDRSSSYDDTSSKIGLKWQVFDDLLLRGTYSESFRAPSVTDLFTGEGEGFPIATDPCSTRGWGTSNTATRANCIAGYTNAALGVSIAGVPNGGSSQPNSQIRSLNGGNPDLQPESGTTKSFGIVYSPSWAEGLNFTLDWYKIELEDVITTRSSNNVMQLCYNPDSLLSNFSSFQQQRDVFCPLITRAGSGDLNTVTTKPFNLDSGEVEGYDFTVAYAMPETSWGKFSFQWDNTYQVENNLFGQVGEYNGSPTWRLRSNLVTNWQKGDFDATWTMRYYSALDEACDGGNYFEYGYTPTEICQDVNDSNGNFLRHENRIGSRLYHDVQVGWKLPWNAKVIGGARNIFAKDPPITRNSFAHSFDASYDLPEGGFWYLQYNQKF
jgi:iron complex outermembrane recepter protein